MAEAGYPEVEGTSWAAVVVPAGTPKEIITMLQQSIAAMVTLPDVKERLDTLGFEPVANTPEECTAFFRAEMAKWSKVIKAAGIRAD
jgi:tripartite-type tricarboxylate transporter receptor subunit TctC